jgi:iron(III) transport system substrate-binding protein
MDHSVLKNAPHPNAARLLINHFLSPEFQMEIANLGLLPVLRDMDARMPADMQPFARVKLLPGATSTNQQGMLNLATEIYK